HQRPGNAFRGGVGREVEERQDCPRAILLRHGEEVSGRVVLVRPRGSCFVNWCWWYRKYAPGGVILEELETRARTSGIGLWADPHPVPPWEWRKRRVSRKGELSGRIIWCRRGSGGRVHDHYVPVNKCSCSPRLRGCSQLHWCYRPSPQSSRYSR